MFGLFAAKKTPAMVPLWSLLPTVLIWTLVSHYVVRGIRAVEHGASVALHRLRKAGWRGRRGFIRVKPVDAGCEKASKCEKSEGSG